MNYLYENLSFCGKRPVVLALADGAGRLLVLPEHGRLMGLYPTEGGANFLWTNPVLDVASSAKAYFSRPGWSNPGGDRTWLAPELELFIGDLERASETYGVPLELDAGCWRRVSATVGEVVLENRARLRMLRARQEVDVRLVKTFTAVPNPLSGSSVDAAGVQYASYRQSTVLELEPGSGSPVRLGIWNLLQLPQPGTMLIPTRCLARAQVVFGSPAAGELVETSSGVRWHMAAPGADTKISIKASAVAGRAGHRRGRSGICDLVVREFSVGVDDDYVDALWTPPHEAGWAFQACCVRSGAECFNELEYHAPAAMTAPGRNVSRDESRVWAFRGPSDVIARIARYLLGDAAEECPGKA